MSKKFRKVLAAILAGTMVLGSGVVANAAEGSGEGSGSLDVVEALDIFQVVLPTDSGTQFDYILDPTGIIAETNAAKYENAYFEPGKTMYFRNEPASGSDIATYSDVSDPIKAYNKSTMDVEIKVQAKIATSSGIDILSNAPVSSGNANTATPSIYLALSDASGDTAITTAGIVATSSIADAASEYEVVYATASGTYKKQLNATASNAKIEDDFDGLFQSYSFNLTGSCNDDGKWVGLTEEPPTVSLVWTIEMPEDASANSPITFANTGDITLTGLTGDKNFAHRMTLSWGSTTSDNLDSDPNMSWDITQWSEEDGGTLKFKLSDGWVTGLSGELVTVTVYLTDGSTLTATAQF